jgi:hypothetical protein
MRETGRNRKGFGAFGGPFAALNAVIAGLDPAIHDAVYRVMSL